MGSEVIGQGEFLRLLRKGRWEYVERVNATGVVAMVAITDDGDMLLVEQERPALGRRVIEIPAGLAGDGEGERDESLQDAAVRELMEETGFAATSWERLMEVPSSAGLTNETITFFRARGLFRVTEGGGDEQEAIRVHLVPRAEVAAWLGERMAAGALVDLKVWAGLFLAGGGS